MLKPVLPDTTNNEIRYELDGAFRKWLHTNPLEKAGQETMILFFEDFSFNRAETLGKLFRIVDVSRSNESDLLIQFSDFNPLRGVTAQKTPPVYNCNSLPQSFLLKIRNRTNVYLPIGVFLTKIKWYHFIKSSYQD
jgi:hypothetical protein